MFGSTPNDYTAVEAARKAAKAYSMEEDTKWVVVGKRILVDNGIHTIYRPCRVSDIDQARQNGFYPVDFHLKTSFSFKKEDMTPCVNTMCKLYDEGWDHNCTDVRHKYEDFSQCENYIPQ